jgi:hypothetical protein
MARFPPTMAPTKRGGLEIDAGERDRMTRAVVVRTGLALLLVASVLANCTGNLPPALFGKDEPKIDPNLWPKDYKKAVITFVTNNEGNPTGLRDAAMSEPVLRPLDNIERYMSCVRYTVPRTGQVTEHLVYFLGGQINQFVKTTPEQCKWAAYKPFPELEKICMGEKCQ